MCVNVMSARFIDSFLEQQKYMEGVLLGEKFVRKSKLSTVGTRAFTPLHMNMCQCKCTNCKNNLCTFPTFIIRLSPNRMFTDVYSNVYTHMYKSRSTHV